MIRVLFVFLFVLAAPVAPIAAAMADDDIQPFTDGADALAQIDSGLVEAETEGKRLLIVLGANWCHDSRGLAAHLADPDIAALMDDHYVQRWVDVGWRDQNHAVMRRFGVPAIYATPTVLIVDGATGELINRDSMHDWGNAYSRPRDEVRDYFQAFAEGAPDKPVGLAESAAVYQALMEEIAAFEAREGERLLNAYRDIGAWRAMAPADRPADFSALESQVEAWRRAMPRRLAELRSQARREVMIRLTQIADPGPVTPETVAALDARAPEIALDLTPFVASRW